MNKQKLYELKDLRKQALDAAEAAMEAENAEEYAAKMEEVKGFNSQIETVEKFLEEKSRFMGETGAQPGLEKTQKTEPYSEAVKAFAAAARAGFPAAKAAGDKMSEGIDADGGYTVPKDIVTRIISLRDAKESLLSEVNVVPVTTKSGRRTFKKRGQHTGFQTVAEAGKFGKTATPQFSTVDYDIEKRGGYLPVTNELMEDSDNNIAAVAEEWLADEARVTANKEILDIINTKTATDLTDLDGILTAWIGLGSTFRATSRLYTNDDGLLWLSTLKDANGRYLLSPNPADTKQLQLAAGPHALPVKTYDNDTLPTVGTKIPMILGDLKEGIAYWDRRSFSVKVSDVATVGELNAFEQDLTIWRGSLRDDCTAWDDTAFLNGYIDTSAAPTPAAGA